MIPLEKRRQVAEWVEEARKSGARLEPCCEVLGISKRTWPRWVRGEEVQEDKRPNAKRPVPANKLREEEREQVLAVWACKKPLDVQYRIKRVRKTRGHEAELL